MVLRMKKTELIKDIILGILCGTVITLVCSVIRLNIELDETNRLLDDPAIRFPSELPRLREYERAKNPMPMVPDVDYRVQKMLNLAAENPELFTDRQIVRLLTR